MDPENNTATAQEIFVAYVETNDSEKATVYDPPIIADTVTFPLSTKTRVKVPTVTHWGTLALMMALGICALILLRRKSAVC